MNAHLMYPEEVFQFIWQQLYFQLHTLQTTNGQKIHIVDPGIWNKDQGPDFLDATIHLDGITWRGHVEIHKTTGDWYHHKHHQDPHYDNTILHVVYKKGKVPACRTDGTIIPELVLEGLIPASFWRNYTFLQDTQANLPCHALLIQTLSSYDHWIRQLGWQRLQQKTNTWKERLSHYQGDFRELLWHAILPRLGGKANHTPFEILAQRIPFGLIQRYQEDVFTVETLLFGGLGLLKGQAKDESHQRSLDRWSYLRHKHKLGEMTALPVKHSRMRPHAFPMLRLAQLAQWVRLFPKWTDLLSMEGMLRFLQTDLGVSNYWHTHHSWGVTHKLLRPCLGKQTKEMLIWNALLPVAMLYENQYPAGQSNTLRTFAYQLKAERNTITRKFSKYPLPQKHIVDTQGIYHLYQSYCKEKKCLSCEIGQTLLTTGLGK
ncbi:MAG: DUF2851 family protein [Bacteroidota bacterium]